MAHEKHTRVRCRAKRCTPLLLWLFCSVLVIFSPNDTPLLAQGWQQHLELGTYDFARAMLPTPDGGFLTAAHFGTGPDLHDAALVKLDPFGKKQWQKTFGGASHDEIDDMESTADGGYILTGGTFSFGSASGDVWLVKTDYLGNIEWQKTYGTTAVEFGRSVIQTSDGGYAIVGRSDNGANVGIYLIKTDALGNEQWSNIYGGAFEDEGWGLAETPDNQLVIVGATTDGGGDRNVYLAKIGLDGAFGWFQAYGGLEDDFAFSVLPLSDGSLVVGGVTNSFGAGDYDVWFLKIAGNGTQIWDKTFGGALGEWGAYLAAMPGGGFALAGSAQSFNNLLDDIYLIRTDDDGNLLWQRTYGNDRKDLPHAIRLLPDGGFAIAGHSRIDDANNVILSSRGYVLRTNSAGIALNSFLVGKVFKDDNADCLPAANESGFEGWMLKAVGSGKTYYGMTDPAGNYSILADTGAYVLTLVPPDEYWNPCQNNISVVLASGFDTVFADFPVQAGIVCADLEVDVATSIVRPCSTGIYQLKYCNVGSATAENAFVEVALDEFYEFLSAGLPVAAQNGNTFRFDLGNVAPGQCEGFPIEVLLSCDAEPGRTHCVTAHIFPDSFCLPVNPQWDGASIEVTATCEADSVRFTLTNVGGGGMDDPMLSIIVEEQIVGKAENYQLQPNQSTDITYPADGSTIRLKTQQTPGHPGRSKPTLAVEGCNGFTPGFVNIFPEDDADRFISKDCRENAAWLAPDQKLAFPKGISAPHYIEPETDIEYLIHFQNTGESTISHVVIRDTLSHWLDGTSLRPGAASHPYQLSVSNEGILQFTFENIGLPDSLTSDFGSHGFVQFRVRQKPGIPFDSLIINHSSVSFDYEMPGAYPWTFHTLDKPELFNLADVSLCMGGIYNGVAYQSDTTFFETQSFPQYDSLIITAVDIGDFNVQVVIDTIIELGELIYERSYEKDTVFTEVFPFENGCDSTIYWTIKVLTGTHVWLTEKSVFIYPNPVGDRLFIQSKAVNPELISLIIINPIGQIMPLELKTCHAGILEIMTGDWQPGLWILRLETDRGGVMVKVLKE